MRYNLSIMWKESVLSVLLLLLFHQICASDKLNQGCAPSSCGKISNISYPFRLKGDPKGCGENRYELACENNVTVLSLYSGKYLVQSINYNNYTIRVVDPGVHQQNCSSLPRYFLSRSNFSDTYTYTTTESEPYQARQRQSEDYYYYGTLLFEHIVIMNCRNPVKDNDMYAETGGCLNWKGYTYAIAGDLKAKDFEVGCHVKLVALTSWKGLDKNEYSYSVMHNALLYGFEISWMLLPCQSECGPENYRDCHVDSSNALRCSYYGIWYKVMWSVIGFINGVLIGLISIIKRQYGHYVMGFADSFGFTVGHYILPYLGARFLIGVILFIALAIYKRRKRHSSIYENIENYLDQNSLVPIGYTYMEIKKMARIFKEKLGEGGYGSVFKGKLRSGPYVAIKMLGKSKSNGQDFISEVATIGRIHHQNIVQLIGYCVEGSKRALVYEFMLNGSLDKFIFSNDGGISLTSEKIYDISIGIARGIAYLHHGCEMQILHFDIKPHNILLDEEFTPKISDFGLAKLYPLDNSIITMTAARGTIGYMAPELFYKNIGRVSHKSDVYSFGMLLMEMASKRKNLNPYVEHSSQLYFPLWIYDQLGKEKVMKVEDVTVEEQEVTKKMIIVSLWCIQLNPNDRPSMNKVIEMLEGDIESLEIPPKPSLYPHETMEEDKRSSSQISSSYSSSYSMGSANNPSVDDTI